MREDEKRERGGGGRLWIFYKYKLWRCVPLAGEALQAKNRIEGGLSRSPKPDRVRQRS